ncbi:calcium ion binding protein, putative [Fagus crenata]
MGVVVIDGSTVCDFMSDEGQFKKSVDKSFASLDLNNDGVLSRTELCKAFKTMRLLETHFGINVTTTKPTAKTHEGKIGDPCRGSHRRPSWVSSLSSWIGSSLRGSPL